MGGLLADSMIRVAGGNMEMSIMGGDSLEMDVSNDAWVKLTQDRVRLRKLTLRGSSVLTIMPGGGKTLRVEDLLIGSSSKLDLEDNDLVVQPGAGVDKVQLLAHIRSRISLAFNGGAWDGPGITSTAAREDLTQLTGVAVIENGEGTRLVRRELGGTVLDAESIFVRVTWQGDADGSGRIDADDYARIDRGFLRRSGLFQWGDFNYSGLVDLDDYLLIDASYLRHVF